MSEWNDYMEQLAERYPDATPVELREIAERESEKADAQWEAEREDRELEKSV